MATPQQQHIIFLVKLLDCGIGGMETHQRAFIEYFIKSHDYKFWVIEKHRIGTMIHESKGTYLQSYASCISIRDCMFLLQLECGLSPIIFANDFWWIEKLHLFRDKFPNSKIFIRSGGNDIELAPWNEGEKSYDERLSLCLDALGTTDYIITNSRFSKIRFISKGIPSEKIKIVRGGVDKNICNMILQDKVLINSLLRKYYNIVSPYIFVFACRMVPFKGISLALQSILSTEFKDSAHLLFVGEGELIDELKDNCAFNGLNASFLGALPNNTVLSIIGGSDVLINTSLELQKVHKGHVYVHTETMGRSMMEAISVHTPIVATGVGGTLQLFEENGDIGAICDCSVNSIAKTLEHVVNTRFSFDIMVDYTWDSIFSFYSELFNPH